MKKLFLLLVLMIVLLGVPIMSNAYPYTYQRLALKKDGQILKTIDLIGDIHRFENEARGEVFDETMWPIPGESERILRENLRRIAERKTGEVVVMLGEFNPHFRVIVRKALEEGIGVRFMGKCLYDIGMKFHEDYALDKKKRLVYLDADLYRRMNRISPTTVENACSLSNQDSLLMRDLASLKSVVADVIYAKIEFLWIKFEGEMLIPVCLGIKSINNTIEGVRLINFVMDIELLIKIFLNTSPHTIVLAGATHCKNVSEILQQQFGFELVRQVGEYSDVRKDELPLPAEVWDLLFEGIEGL